MVNCTHFTGEEDYLASPDFLHSTATKIGFVCIPVNLYSIYLIIYKTSKTRQEIKWCMLHLQVWVFLLDLEYTLMINFFFFLPATAFTSLGVLTTILHIPTKYLYYYDSFLFGGFAVSLVLLFENRHYNIIPFGSSLRVKNFKYRIALACVNFTLGSGYIIPSIYFVSPDQDKVKQELLSLYPCPNPIFYTDATFALSTDSNSALSILASIGGFFLLVELFVFITHVFYYLYKMSGTTNISANTKKLQRKFFLTTCAQIAIPIMVIVIPIWYMSYVLSTLYINQAVLNIAMLFIPLHGTASTIVAIMTNQSYRDFTIALLLCRKPKAVDFPVTNVSTVARRTTQSLV